jgi:hypothetical protein
MTTTIAVVPDSLKQHMGNGRTSAIRFEQKVINIRAQARNRTGGTTMGMSHFTTKPHARMPRQHCVCQPAVPSFQM